MTSTSYVDHAKYTKVNGQYIKWAAWVLEYKQYSYPDELEEVSSKILSHLELKFCPPKYRKLNMENPVANFYGKKFQIKYQSRSNR